MWAYYRSMINKEVKQIWMLASLLSSVLDIRGSQIKTTILFLLIYICLLRGARWKKRFFESTFLTHQIKPKNGRKFCWDCQQGCRDTTWKYTNIFCWNHNIHHNKNAGFILFTKQYLQKVILILPCSFVNKSTVVRTCYSRR